MLTPTLLKTNAMGCSQAMRYLLSACAGATRLLRAAMLACSLWVCLGAQAADNTIYAVAGTAVYTLNPSTGAVVSTGTLSFSTNAAGRDPLTGRVYYLEAASPFRVAYFDPLTSLNTVLPGQLGFSTNRAAVDANGVLWVMDPANNNLYTVSTTTGTPSFQGTISGVPTGLGGDIAFSPSGQLYVVASTVLYAVTGFSATSINTSAPAAMPGLAFVDGGAPIAAATTNLYRISLSGNTSTLVGSTGVTISDLAAYAKFADVVITKTAGSAIFTRGSNATYNLAVRNNGPQSSSGVFTVTDTLPTGLTFVSGTGSGWTCSAAGQNVTCTNNTASLASGSSLADIVLTVAVGASAPNSVTNTALVSSTTLDSNNANNTSTVATSVGAPTIAKSFNPIVVPTGAPSTLTLTITNSTATALTGVAFSDPLPANLVIASTPNLTNTCGGTITGGAAGNNSVGLLAGTLAGSASCTITVAVSSSVVGTYSNTATGVSSVQTGVAGAPSNTAVLDTARPTVVKSFSPSSIGPGTKSTLTITLSNAANVALAGAAFTDTFPTAPAAMTVATPLTTTNTCGGTLQNNAGGTLAAGSAGIRLTGGTIPAGSSCAITVEVTASTAGDYANTIAAGGVTTTNGGSNLAAASAILSIPRPGISKFFSPSAISTNSPSTLTITLTNSSSTTYTGASFTDTYPAGITNTATPGVTNTCAGTVTAAANGTSLALAGGTIPANGSCQITVKVTSATAGNRTNTIAAGGLTTANGGSNAALTSAILVATVAPDLQLTKTHSGTFAVGTNAVYTLTVNNTAGSAASSGTTTVTDTLPAGLTYVSATGTGWTCSLAGQTVTCTSTTVINAGATSPNPLTLTVAVAAAAAPSVINTATVSGGGESNNTNNNATDTATVFDNPTVAKSFSPTVVGTGQASLLTLTLTNPNAAPITGVAFTDTYPASLVNTAAPGAATTCGGTVTAAAGGGSVALTGGSIPANGSCVVTVSVTSGVAGNYTNTIAAGAVATGNAGSNKASASAVLQVLVQLGVNKSFSPASIAPNATSVLTILLTNPNATAVAGAAFTDTYPAGLVNTGTASGATTCTGGTVTAANGGSSVALASGTVPANGSCAVTVNVTSATVGIYNNSTGPVTTTNAGTAAAGTATLTVPTPPAISKAFSPASIAVGVASTLTFTLTNSNAVALTGLSFNDVYPTGLVNTASPNLANSCGGTLTGGAAGGNSVGLTGGTLAANSSCTVKVDVTSGMGGAYSNVSGAVTSTNGGTGTTASATLTVLGKPSISKSFTPSSIAAGGTSTLALTITNSEASAITGVAFTDAFPSGLLVAAAPALTDTCSGTISGGAAGNNSLNLTNGSLAANSSCSITVAVTAATAGTYNNNTSGVSSTQTGAAGAGSNVAQLVVVGPPSISKAFSPTVIGINGTSTLAFTVTNNNAVPLTGVAFGDTYPAGVVNTGSPAPTSSCGGTTTGGVAGGNTIGLTGGAVPANSTCTLSVQVTSGATGTYNNVSGAVSSTNGGTGNTASATLTVSANPSISKAFSPSVIPAGTTSTITFVLSNSAVVPALLASFTDSLPPGMLVSSPASSSNSCGGTLTANAGAGTISLSNGIIPASGSCTVTTQVTVAAMGSYPNTASAVSSNLGNGSPSNTATLVATAPATIVKSFNPTSILANGMSTMSFVISNPNGIPIAGMSFTDNFPSGGLQLASAPNVSNNCGGVVSGATPGSTSVSFAGGTLAASASCIITMVVTSPTPGSFTNTTTGVSANETATGAGANAALLTVVSVDLRLTKTHSGNFTVGSVGAYSLLVNNTLGTAPTSGIVTVVDTLPAGLSYTAAGSGGTGWTCSASGQVVTCTSSAVIAAGAASASPITINVSVAATAVPSVTNSAAVSGGGEPAANAGNNSAFDATVVVMAAQNTFQPDGTQTALPGTTVFYPHTFNASLAGTVAFSTTNVTAPAVAGWSNVIYRDSNCNGVLDGAEGNAPQATSISVIAGDSVCIVIKEFVPASAPYSASDVITVTATFAPVSGPVVTYTRTDTTTVGNPGGAGLSLSKTVRNVTTSGSAGTANAAKPGETLEYTIAYSNASADPLATIVIHDATPAFTAFVSAACGAPLPANVTACNVTTQPAGGAAGGIVWTLTGSLAPTQAGTVVFRVTLQ